MQGLCQPKGEKPIWEIFYDNLKEYPIGTIFSYQRLKELTGFDIKTDRGPIYPANKRFLKNHNKTLINIRNHGYKFGLFAEQMKQGSQRRLRAGRQVRMGKLEVMCGEAKTPQEKEFQINLVNHAVTLVDVLGKRSAKAIEAQKTAIKEQTIYQKEIEKFQEQLNNMKKKIMS